MCPPCQHGTARASMLALVSTLTLLTTATCLAVTPEEVHRVEEAARFRPGNFLPSPEVAVGYRFGWSGIEAANGRVVLRGNGLEGDSRLEGAVQTTGLARALWSLDATLDARSGSGIRPLSVLQSERYRGGRERKVEIAFENNRFLTWQWEATREPRPAKPKVVRRAGVHSLHSALLALRSVDWAQQTRASLLITPGKSLYLLEAEYLGRETLRGSFGESNAILLDVRLGKLLKDDTIEPHRKVRHIRVWLDPGPARIPLRIEADVFIGYVFAEVTSPGND